MKWVTRERPKIDRIACPWLIRRFVEADAEFLYVPTERFSRSPPLPARCRTTFLGQNHSPMSANFAPSMHSWRTTN